MKALSKAFLFIESLGAIEKHLKNCNYADLVIFSSTDLAMSFMCSEELC
jgi:hypothetical protein